jgi:hypothetical protein
VSWNETAPAALSIEGEPEIRSMGERLI